MELISVSTDEAASGRVRVTGTVAYDDRPGSTDEYWFEYPAELAGSLSRSGNAWLVCLAPMAASLGEPLRLSLPADPLLVRNVGELMAIWKSWYPRLHVIPVVAASESPAAIAGGRKTGVFFSGGVDSLFTLLHNEPAHGGRFPADDLITIHGFDILLESKEAFDRHRDRLDKVAAETGKTLVPARMNLRNTRLRELSMSGLWHGCALASVGLLLENRYERLWIAASDEYSTLVPWGSHPLTDPLFSTSRTAFLHDGAAYARWQKLEFLADVDVALRSLRVCSRNTSDENCGACEKCYRNMIILEVLGILGRAPTFPARRLDLEKASAIFIGDEWHMTFYGGLRRFAASRGRHDVVKALDESFRRSRWRRLLLRASRRIGASRYGGRAGRWLKSRALAGCLR